MFSRIVSCVLTLSLVTATAIPASRAGVQGGDPNRLLQDTMRIASQDGIRLYGADGAQGVSLDSLLRGEIPENFVAESSDGTLFRAKRGETGSDLVIEAMKRVDGVLVVTDSVSVALPSAAEENAAQTFLLNLERSLAALGAGLAGGDVSQIAANTASVRKTVGVIFQVLGWVVAIGGTVAILYGESFSAIISMKTNINMRRFLVMEAITLGAGGALWGIGWLLQQD